MENGISLKMRIFNFIKIAFQHAHPMSVKRTLQLLMESMQEFKRTPSPLALLMSVKRTPQQLMELMQEFKRTPFQLALLTNAKRTPQLPME